jgi:hypothetical protein
MEYNAPGCYIMDFNIKMYLKVMGWWSVDWVRVLQESDKWRALMAIVMNLSGVINDGDFLG